VASVASPITPVADVVVQHAASATLLPIKIPPVRIPARVPVQLPSL
jgi:hypothetical protein